MHDWMEMAESIGRKFVENGQERILQRIFDGVNSDFFLDTSDFKESDQHKLLHLVWRKFTRNKCPTEGLKTTTSDSTQTAVELRHKISDDFIFPGNSNQTLTSNTDWFQTRDMRGPFDANKPAFTSDSYKTPAKGQSSKPITLKTTNYQIGTPNRFDCLNHDIPARDVTLFESGRKSPSPPRIFQNKNRHSPGSLKSEVESKITPDKNLSKIPMSFGSNGWDLRPLSSTVPGPSVSSSPPQYKIGTVKTCIFDKTYKGHTYMGSIKSDDHVIVPYSQSKMSFNPGSQVTYELEYIFGKQRAIHVSPYQDAFSPGHLL